MLNMPQVFHKIDKEKDMPATIKVVSPRGKIYNVSGIGYPLCDPFCDCQGFSFRGNCSHVDKVRKDYEINRNLSKNSGTSRT